MRTVTVDTANNVLHHFDTTQGYPGGGFFTALMDACGHADERNLAKLLFAFPEQVTGYMMAARAEGGMDDLLEIVEEGQQ